MANRRVLTDTVVLQNYIGEVNDEAAYQETTLVNCYFPTNEGADLNIQGKKANDSGTVICRGEIMMESVNALMSGKIASSAISAVFTARAKKRWTSGSRLSIRRAAKR